MATNLPLRPGQELGIRWRSAEGLVREDLRRLRLDADGNPSAACHVKHIDPSGISVYIARGHAFGGDIEAFVPATIMWQAYFEPLGRVDPLLETDRHYTRVFPRDFR